MNRPDSRVCATCVLPATFPGISFDAGGVCSHCRTFGGKTQSRAEEGEKYRLKFLSLVEQLTAQAASAPRSYDVLMAYSGGKDSTYTLKLLKKDYGLRVLAVTFDHGFVSPQALSNIGNVCDCLGVDHLMFRPARGLLSKAFRASLTADVYPLKALERASAICNTCMNMAKSFFLKHAVRTGIPLIAYGWSPGQAPVQSSVMRLNAPLMRQTQGVVRDSLRALTGEDHLPCLPDNGDFEIFERQAGQGGGLYFHNLHPLAFLDYDEASIVEEISKLGWQAPADTDANSTNCLLNGFANRAHMEKYGFHPYAFEIASLVRQGCMSREAGLAKLAEPPDAAIARDVAERLGL